MILLGTVSAATAEPKQEETSGRVRHTDDQDKKNDAPRRPSDWVELASPTPAKHGTEFIVIGEDAGTFSKLRVEAAKGKTIVKRVKVYFEDGEVKTVALGKTIAKRGKDSVIVDLGDARPIDRVVITTEPTTSGQYSLYGSTSGGVVSSR